MSAPGKIHLLLHAHLPFVREPSYDRFLEENWFFEAMAETYLPIVQMLWRLHERGVPGTLNLSVSSSLLAMLTDGLLLQKFTRHLHKQAELLQKEKERNRGNDEVMTVVEFYARRQDALIDFWESVCACEIVPAFKRLEEVGKLSLLTCVGTHPFLPAYQSDPEAVRLQLGVTVRAFEEAFGRRPRGLWLPECGFYEGLDSILAEFGFEYFFVETHGVLLAKPAPKYGVFAPIKTPAGLYCMGREQSSSMEVWSRRTGYPGHPEYREFFKDIAYERDRNYLGEYFMAGETAIETGLKYCRITGSEDKQIYRPWNAMRLAEDHARLFVANREATVTDLLPKMEGNKVSILCPYDAELFGHWWFEGPEFIERMFERAASSGTVEMASVEQTIDEQKSREAAEPALAQTRRPAFSSWGEGGFGEVWMNDEVSWEYPLFFRMRAMQKSLKTALAKSRKNAKLYALGRRYLAQVAREVLLFQASDWAFMIHNKSAADYARSRLNEHSRNVESLYASATAALSGIVKRPDTSLLQELENKDNLFPWIGEML
jgi:1,4-alpha-glucan branching enzyme